MTRMYKFYVLLCSICLFLLGSCDKDPNEVVDGGSVPTNLGWTGDDQMSTIQTNVAYFGSTGNLPAKFDLVPKFPPIGDQGQYGTCIAWSVGYNYKTAINGMDKGYNASQLNSAAYQFSPKDLFLAIPDTDKGANCAGTSFVDALTLLQNRGVATMQTVPYSGLGNCGKSNSNPNWVSEANQHKIKYWRKVEATSPNDIKALIANNIPVMLGAKLADNFMSWNSEAVLSSNSSFNNVGQHSYHALVIAGYDDSKNAFRVINSWGKSWGSSGYIWVEYNFLLDEFCRNPNKEKSLFMAVNEGGNIPPPDQPDPNTTEVDLAAWVFNDYSDGYYQGYPKRVSNFNVYNIGNQSANASKEWSVYCLAFNAYDANDYGVLYSCTIDQSVAYGTEYCADFNNCTYNVNIPSGSNFAYELGFQGFEFAYTMPLITGEYYLVVYVDAFDTYVESDETNNIFYPYFDPIYFTNGVGFTGGTEDRSAQQGNTFRFDNKLSPDAAMLKKSDHHTLTNRHPNAYRSSEISRVISNSKKDGRFAQKIEEMIKRNHK
jgi:hypothetical protein